MGRSVLFLEFDDFCVEDTRLFFDFEALDPVLPIALDWQEDFQ